MIKINRKKVRNNSYVLIKTIDAVFFIYITEDNFTVISSHEELKEVVLLCLQDLLNRCFTNVIEELYTRQYAPTLAHGIYLCVSIAKYEKSRSLR